jgi:hypothetical protein
MREPMRGPNGKTIPPVASGGFFVARNIRANRFDRLDLIRPN